MKKCPYCSESIQDDAVKCRFCGEFLTKETPDSFKSKVTQTAAPQVIKGMNKENIYFVLGRLRMRSEYCHRLALLLSFILVSFIPSFSNIDLTMNNTSNSFQQEYSEEKDARVIRIEAVLRIEPNLDSLVIKKVPLGAVLSVRRRYGDWVMANLPADKEGIVISGWIQIAFLEIEFNLIKPKIRPSVIVSNNEASLPAKGFQEELFTWKSRLEKAKSTREMGLGLEIGGMILSLTGLVLALKGSNETQNNSTGRWVMTISGLALTTIGVIIHSPAAADVRALEMEGAGKGYMTSNMRPGLAMSIIFSF